MDHGRTQFFSEEDSIIVVKMDLYGVKSGVEFIAKLEILLHNIGYTQFKADPDI